MGAGCGGVGSGGFTKTSGKRSDQICLGGNRLEPDFGKDDFTKGFWFLVPYRLNSAQFAQNIFAIACNCLKFSLLRHKKKKSSPKRFLGTGSAGLG
jgi:hypothetical protein